jgi:AraC-like DNA-binding protein
MPVLAGFLRTIILLGALQGFIVAALLLASGHQKPEERTSRRVLAAIIFLIALACLDIYLDHLNWWTSSTAGSLLSALLPMIVAMPLGPLAYFYVRSLEEPGFRLTRAYRPHFYPVVIDLFQHVVILCVVICMLLGFVHEKSTVRAFGDFLDDYNQYADIPRWISLTIYLFWATRFLKRRGGLARAGWAGTFLRVLWAFDLLWLAFNIPYELPRIGDALIDKFDWYPLYIPLVVMIYYLGVKGYFIAGRAAAEISVVDGMKAVGISIPREKVGQLVISVRKSMEEERLWLQADLNLGSLARHCGVAPKLLSALLNQHMGSTFNEFVNRYRIAAVKEKLLLPESRELTIAGLAYECGFNSLPTFQRAFKAITGMSPKEYLAAQMIGQL